MKLKTFAFLAIAAMTTAFAHASADLVITRVFINPQGNNDDSQGYEGFVIKNVGDASIDLGASHVALVAVENEHGQHGELDWYYQFSGTLAAGASLAIRDLPAAGGLPDVVTANGAAQTGSTTSLEFFSGNGGTDMSNSGDNFILVSGFNASAVNPNTGVAYAFLDQLDTNANLIFDWTATMSTSDDLWTGIVYDYVAVAPDAGESPSGFDNYCANLTANHGVTGVVNSDGWTADCIIRLDDPSHDFDEAIQMDVLARDPVTHIIKNDIGDTPVQFNLMSHNSYTITGAGSVPSTVRFEFSYLYGGNITDWSNYQGLTIGGVLYTTA